MKVFMETPCSLSLYSNFQRMFLYMPMCCATFEICKSFRSLESCDFSGLNLISMAADCSVYYSVAFLVSLAQRVRKSIDLTFSTMN